MHNPLNSLNKSVLARFFRHEGEGRKIFSELPTGSNQWNDVSNDSDDWAGGRGEGR